MKRKFRRFMFISFFIHVYIFRIFPFHLYFHAIILFIKTFGEGCGGWKRGTHIIHIHWLTYSHSLLKIHRLHLLNDHLNAFNGRLFNQIVKLIMESLILCVVPKGSIHWTIDEEIVCCCSAIVRGETHLQVGYIWFGFKKIKTNGNV